MHVAFAAIATSGNHQTLSVFGQIGKQLPCLGIPNLGAYRYK
jgi:hypothetical protein